MVELIGEFIWTWCIGGWDGLVRDAVFILIGAFIGVNNPRLMNRLKLVSKQKLKDISTKIEKSAWW